MSHYCCKTCAQRYDDCDCHGKPTPSKAKYAGYRSLQEALDNAARIRREIPQLIQPEQSSYDMVTIAMELEHLITYMHSLCMHPMYEYEITEGSRKAFDNAMPPGEGWIPNVHRGRNAQERSDYHEESYWMRLDPQLQVTPKSKSKQKQ